MPFFKQLRRSRPSFRTTKSVESKSNESHSNGEMTSGQSSTTLDTSSYSSVTPPSSIKPDRSSPNLPALNECNDNNANGADPPAVTQRPPLHTTPMKRNSVVNGSVMSSNGASRSPSSSSPYAPRIISISDGSWVHQKVLLLYGQTGDPRHHPLDGTVTAYHHQDNFPSVSWPVTASHFKALVHLVPGPNRLRFDFVSTKLSSGSAHPAIHSSWICINYLPLDSAPPLHLVVLLGKDSEGTFDASPEKTQREGRGLDTAIRKYRTAAYLWQAFTGEQMFRNNLGRRCFRFEEEWQTGTLSRRDVANGQMRNEAKVHVVRTEKTVAELRDLNIAQQYGPATQKDELFKIARDAVRNHFQPQPGQKQYVSVLLLDSHWDTGSQTITGHAALGSDGGDIKMAIFGSHSLQSYPCSLEEVVDAFSDCSRTNTDFVANDCGEAGSNWEAANIGIGAHLHEVGHLFGCPHQESGIMLRDYVRLNRTFTTREPFSTRTKAQGLKLSLPQDECSWHRLDALRFRFHPCFRLPTDAPVSSDDSVQVWPVENGKILITASSGIAFLELYAEGDQVCRSFVEYLNTESSPNGLPKQVTVTESELRQRVFGGEREKKKQVRMTIFSGALGSHTVNALSDLKSKRSVVKLPKGHTGYKSSQLGFSQMEGSHPEQVILDSAFVSTKLLTSIKVYHGASLDGLEFFYEDATSQLFGGRGGKPGGDEFVLDTRRGEILLGFYVRAGAWIDGIEILTSLGRKSGIYGNAHGGSGHTLIPPLGYKVAGVSGSCGPWVDGFSLIISH
ncbi:jacalin-like lectin domain-containing protein [Aspergillus campestris IBT 28561]|uniref:Jacalin-like lectin domain-containing protein n=1 Tax=Aspergillus campestris (strain IBT 28561) TaxID=1392248 RepID=A0A2I1DDX3_ASPC2|nr:jacalin-like lectin domain-containing protein [Aspergillus campestris IBT 28561]PKY08089.1 jacalin-like lectin domain-containing protein [Aspergillus campestris IBT 28561]